MFFCERIFTREHPIRFRGSVIIEKQCLILRIARSSQEPFKWGRTLRDIFSWNLKKYLGLISF